MEALAASLSAEADAVSTDLSLEREFNERLAECSALAFRVALGVLHNRADAEDVAQEAFLRAYRNFAGLRERSRFRAWLVRITWRLAIDRWHAARRRLRREEAVADPPPAQSVEAAAAWREFEARLRSAVEELPEKLRLVLVLVAIEGHGTQEAAALLGLPEGTVKSRLFLARKKLAEKLRPGSGMER